MFSVFLNIGPSLNTDSRKGDKFTEILLLVWIIAKRKIYHRFCCFYNQLSELLVFVVLVDKLITEHLPHIRI